MQLVVMEGFGVNDEFWYQISVDFVGMGPLCATTANNLSPPLVTVEIYILMVIFSCIFLNICSLTRKSCPSPTASATQERTVRIYM